MSRRSPRCTLRAAALSRIAVAALGGLLSAGQATATQDARREVHREVVVVGPQAGERHVVLGQLANRAYLGVHLLSLTPELRRHFGAAEDRGVLVSKVEPDSPAAAAGVEVGDLISTVDGSPVATPGQLVGRIRHRHEGERVDLGIVRDGSPMTLQPALARTERREVEVGKFVWHDGEGGPFTVELGPNRTERIIAVDPETINESVGQLLERLEAGGGVSGALRLQAEERRELEKRIAELEQRLLAMERQLRERLPED